MYATPPYKNSFYVPVCFIFPMCPFQSTNSNATKQAGRPTRARAPKKYIFLVENTSNACKSIKKRPCTLMFAIFAISATSNRNTLLSYFGDNLPKLKTFSSHNLTTTSRNATCKHNSADRSLINNSKTTH